MILYVSLMIVLMSVNVVESFDQSSSTSMNNVVIITLLLLLLLLSLQFYPKSVSDVPAQVKFQCCIFAIFDIMQVYKLYM